MRNANHFKIMLLIFNILQEEEKIFELIELKAEKSFTKNSSSNSLLKKKPSNSQNENNSQFSSPKNVSPPIKSSFKSRFNIHPGKLSRIKMKVNKKSSQIYILKL